MMRNAVLTALLLAVLIWCFSVYGPRVPVDSSGIGPGDDRMGESPLVVAGPGAGIVDIAEAPGVAEAPDDREPEETQGREVGVEPEVLAAVDWTDVALFLAGAGSMLVGLIVSPVVAWLLGKATGSRQF